MKEKIRDLEGEMNGLKIELRMMKERMQDLLDVLFDMRRKYASSLNISENEFLDLERVQ